MVYVLFNPLANNGRGREDAEKAMLRKKGNKVLQDVREIKDFNLFFQQLEAEDEVIVSGGDGTLQHFINDIPSKAMEHKLYYYPSGSGNDFCNDIEFEKNGEFLLLNSYIEDLPITKFNGIERKFLNNMAMGIDGYVCQKADEHRAHSKRKVNYTSIAAKALLYGYKPCKAKVWVDGELHEYEHVWMIPTMKGRYYGGGMMITPMQDRHDEERKVTVCIVHQKNRFQLLKIFPKIFTGEHVDYSDSVSFFKGSHVKVEFEHPVPVQVDGETYLDVLSYEVNG